MNKNIGHRKKVGWYRVNESDGTVRFGKGNNTIKVFKGKLTRTHYKKSGWVVALQTGTTPGPWGFMAKEGKNIGEFETKPAAITRALKYTRRH